jgi:hypothetical protein
MAVTYLTFPATRERSKVDKYRKTNYDVITNNKISTSP